MIKVTYIISDIDKALAFEWIAQSINKEKFHLSFILLNPGPSALFDYLTDQRFDVITISCRGKKDWPAAILKVFKVLKQKRPDIVHCHLIQANIIGLIAAKLAGIKKRIYTRHHSSLHHVYFPKGVWWDKLSNSLSTHIVAISGSVQNILTDWEKAKRQKVILIPHGFLLDSFSSVNYERVQSFRERNGINQGQFVIGVIARFTEWKGVQYIIPAFKTFAQEHPNAVLLLLNAKGDYENEIKQLLETIPEINYRLITFENDIISAYKAMDVFVHTPIDEHSEAFGQTYVEALAAGVPSVFTLSGIATDFIVDRKNALVVPFKDSNAICLSLSILLEDQSLKQRIVANGNNSVKRFDLSTMIQNLENLYASG